MFHLIHINNENIEFLKIESNKDLFAMLSLCLPNQKLFDRHSEKLINLIQINTPVK